jgi:hypothetical protein
MRFRSDSAKVTGESLFRLICWIISERVKRKGSVIFTSEQWSKELRAKSRDRRAKSRNLKHFLYSQLFALRSPLFSPCKRRLLLQFKRVILDRQEGPGEVLKGRLQDLGPFLRISLPPNLSGSSKGFPHLSKRASWPPKFHLGKPPLPPPVADDISGC